ncbi:unnamed protein product [Arabidopsis thaliana]|uniref:Transmembrane protein n=1 Tax=Arabidopsis thaliana TaxID=3702 RepID=A0A5S9XQ62_ARATH|nr:unnamed protein product [Arabidopsis thaliana]
MIVSSNQPRIIECGDLRRFAAEVAMRLGGFRRATWWLTADLFGSAMANRDSRLIRVVGATVPVSLAIWFPLVRIDLDWSREGCVVHRTTEGG